MQKYSHREPVVFKQWECYGQPKIALRIQDDVEMVCVRACATVLSQARMAWRKREMYRVRKWYAHVLWPCLCGCACRMNWQTGL